jgi:XTP/dITP diphosphohydrolase
MPTPGRARAAAAAGTFAFVTSNPHKLAEVRAIVEPFGLGVRWRHADLPEPQADRLETVVQAKLAAAPPDRLPLLVEDSGLFLDGLRGFPGVYSKYVYASIGLPGILRLLEGRPRRAVFRTVAGLRHGTRVRFFVGETRGSIARSQRGRNGFGYDPIFVPSGSRSTFAELPPEVKNRLSHRGRAIRSAARAIVTGRI